MSKDLTKGHPTKVLLMFTLPLLLGNIFQQFYNIADSVVVGKFVNENALGAVGSSFPILFLSIAVAAGVGTGCGVVISQFYGAQKMTEVKSTVNTSIITFLVLGVVFAVIGQFIIDPMLALLKSPAEIIQYSKDYLSWIFLGSIFTFLYNVCNSIFTALGDSKTPMYMLMIAASINVVLDLIFVIYFHMEVVGVAVATVIAQALAAIVSYYLLRKRLNTIYCEEQPKKFDVQLLKKIIHIAIPSTLQQSMISIGMLAVQGLINSFGNVVVAGFTAAQKIDSIAMMPMMNVSNAMSTFTAQNIGADEIKRIKQGYWGALRAAFVTCIIISIVVFLFGDVLISLFVDQSANAGVYKVGTEYLKVVSIFYFLMSLMFVTNGVLRGSGDMRAFLVSSMVNLFSRVTFAYMLSSLLGYTSIFWAIPIGWSIGTVISIIRYRTGKWQTKAIVRKEKMPDLELS